eukprot:1193963-Prorocentrum_minimum.AAC.1
MAIRGASWRAGAPPGTSWRSRARAPRGGPPAPARCSLADAGRPARPPLPAQRSPLERGRRSRTPPGVRSCHSRAPAPICPPNPPARRTRATPSPAPSPDWSEVRRDRVPLPLMRNVAAQGSVSVTVGRLEGGERDPSRHHGESSQVGVVRHVV